MLLSRCWSGRLKPGTYGYELINTGQLDSFLDGKARKITVASILRYIARKLAAAGAARAAPQPRRRGMSPKASVNERRP
jgi:hypothetical protein